MAKMWPSVLPDEIRYDRFRQAECKVYDKLEEALDDTFTVFYSRPWLGTTWSGEEIDGECDFVVAHPEYGFLALEVKGGGIVYDPETEKWKSIDRNGFEHSIKDPVRQAVASKHQLLHKLKNSPEWRSRRIGIRHGVIFPDSNHPELSEDLGADKPLYIFCFKEELFENLLSWILNRFGDGDFDERHVEPLGVDGIRALERILAKPICLKQSLSAILEEDDRQIEYLTMDQFQILRSIEENPRALITGGAGTGKTLLAMEEARRYAENGKKVLFLCYNRPLSSQVRSALQSELGIDVYTFHGFCLKVTRTGNISEDTLDNDRLSRLPDQCLKALQKTRDYRYDAVIIDEGQDFQPSWWRIIDLIAGTEENGILRVFADNNQRVYNHASCIPKDVVPVSIRLIRNLRNTRYIHEEVQKHYSGYHIDSPFRDGVEVTWITVESEEEMRKAVRNRVEELIIDGELQRRDIAILASSEDVLSYTVPGGKIGAYYTGKCDDDNQTSIIADTVRRFKGLESKVVILLLSSDLVRSEELLYVGLSRARTQLTVIGIEKQVLKVREGGEH